MHSAPAVSYPVGRSSVRTICLLLPWFSAGLVCAAWILPSDQFSAAHGLALILWLCAAGLVYAELRRQAEGLLGWDGQSWSWEAQGRRHVGTLRARLDWQRGLLLEFHPWDGRGFWIWPERRMAPLIWDGLRRAVYAPAVATSTTPVSSAAREAGP